MTILEKKLGCLKVSSHSQRHTDGGKFSANNPMGNHLPSTITKRETQDAHALGTPLLSGNISNQTERLEQNPLEANCPLSDSHDIASESISIDDAIESLGMGKFQGRVLIAAGLCFTADATEVMLLSFLSLTLQSEWGLTADQTAVMTSCVFAGSLVGTLTLGYLGDHYGRRPIFLLASAIIGVFGLLTAAAKDYASLVIIRFMVGFGVGGLTVPFDIYAEFLPTSHRGRYLLNIEYFWTAGSLITPLFAYLTLGVSWRLFVIVCAVPCIISGLLGVCLVPESPRWLISVGDCDKALKIMKDAALINGLNPDQIFPDTYTLKDEHVGKSNFRDLLSPRWRRISVLLWFTWLGYAIGYYGTILAVTQVFEIDGGNENKGAPNFDYKAIFISASAEIVGLFMNIHTIDRIGRIPSQVIDFICGGIFLFSISMTASFASETLLTILAFFARAFTMAASCVTWISTAEILTTEIRATGHSAANAIGRTGAFISPFLVGTDKPIKVVGSVMFGIQLLTALCAFHLPETKGRIIGQTSLDDNNERKKGQSSKHLSTTMV